VSDADFVDDDDDPAEEEIDDFGLDAIKVPEIDFGKSEFRRPELTNVVDDPELDEPGVDDVGGATEDDSSDEPPPEEGR
jgi:hypothetical protein